MLRSLRVMLALCALGGLCAFAAACDDDSTGTSQAGGPGEPCARYGCQPGSTCVDDRCVVPDAEVPDGTPTADDALAPDAAPNAAPDATADAVVNGADGDGDARASDQGPPPEGAPLTIASGAVEGLTTTYVGGRPAVAWYDPGAHALRYAWARRDAPRQAGDWVVHTVVDRAVRDPSLIDLDGSPALAFHDPALGQLLFARADVVFPRAAGDWAIHTVDATGNVGLFARLAVTDRLADDAGGALGLAYYDADRGALKWARARSRAPAATGDWQIETVDANDDAGQHVAVAFEVLAVNGQPAVRPVLAYYAAGPGDLRRAVGPAVRPDLPAQPWLVETVDAEGDVGRFAAIGGDGEVIAYRDTADRALRVARRVDDDEGLAWRVEVLDASGDAGRFAQVEDRFGRPRVTWLDDHFGQIKQARLGADEVWSLRVIEAPGAVSDALAYAPAPCGVEQDEGVGRHTGLFVHADPRAGALRFAYDAAPEGNWFLHHVGPRARAAVLLDVDGRPALIYGDLQRGGVHFAVAGSRLAVESDAWSATLITDAGRVTQIAAIPLGEGLAAAWRDEPGQAVVFAQTATRAPVGPGDWTVHRLAPRGDLHLAGLIDAGGAPALAIYDRGSRALRYARATRPDPRGPDDWLLHRVQAEGAGGAQAALADIAGRPHLAWAVGGADGATTEVRVARATALPPTSSADWSVSEVGFALPADKPLAGLALRAVEGRPVVVAGADALVFARARVADPVGPDDWVRHVADARRVSGVPVLGVWDDLPVLFYGLADTDTDASLWLGTTRVAAPNGRDAWRFARLAERDGPQRTISPFGTVRLEDVSWLAYGVDACLAYGWAAAP